MFFFIFSLSFFLNQTLIYTNLSSFLLLNVLQYYNNNIIYVRLSVTNQMHWMNPCWFINFANTVNTIYYLTSCGRMSWASMWYWILNFLIFYLFSHSFIYIICSYYALIGLRGALCFNTMPAYQIPRYRHYILWYFPHPHIPNWVDLFQPNDII